MGFGGKIDGIGHMGPVQVPPRGAGVGDYPIRRILEILRYDRTGWRKIQTVANPAWAVARSGKRRGPDKKEQQDK